METVTKKDPTQIVKRLTSKRLIVEARAEDTNQAAPGNRVRSYLLLSVMDLNGNPVKDIKQADVKVDAMIVGPGGALVDITRFNHSPRMDGFYFIDLKPIRKETWNAGPYIFSISVNSKRGRGQTFAEVFMD